MQTNTFLTATNSLQEQTYMSDMNNYLAVHATSYLPKINKDGIKYIPSTAMAQDFDNTRSTIHVSLNHIVMGHGYGDWSEAPYIIMTPLTDLIKVNGTPAEISAVDTYFSVYPDKGLILPANYHIIMPTDNIPDGKLYEIHGNMTVYKHENFTDNDEKQLLVRMSPTDKNIYQKYKTGELEDYEIESEMNTIGETGKHLYRTAKDKKAFLRGLLENKCNAMLATEARNMAMEKTAGNMGFKLIENTYDGSGTLQAVERTATAHNIPGNSSNKGHFNSIYSEMENISTDINISLYGNWFFNNKGILNYTTNIKKLAEELITNAIPQKNVFIQALVNNKPLKLYNIFVDTFNNAKKYLSKNKDYKTISEWDSKTDYTIRRYCEKQEKAFEQWRQKASSLPEYNDFINALRLNKKQILAKKSLEY